MADFESEIHDLYFILCVFAVVIPLELFFFKDWKTSIKGRLVNILFMLTYIFLGGHLLKLALPYLEFVTRPSPITNIYLYMVSYLLMADFLFYLYHRLQHSNRFLWKIHRLHHSDLDMNITTSFRTNLLENGIQYTVLYLPTVFILGHNNEAIMLTYYVAFGALFFGHLKMKANFGELSKWIVNPAVHRIHHSREKIHRNKNFAQVFSFYDRLGKTYHHPAKDEFPSTGLN